MSAFSFFYCFTVFKLKKYTIILIILFPDFPHLTKYFHEAEYMLKSYCAIAWSVKKFLTFYGLQNFIIVLARAPNPPAHPQG